MHLSGEEKNTLSNVTLIMNHVLVQKTTKMMTVMTVCTNKKLINSKHQLGHNNKPERFVQDYKVLLHLGSEIT